MSEFYDGLSEFFQDLNKTKDGETEKSETTEVKEVIKNDAKIYYDENDLISFHELFLSKPLVKACSKLNYDHPTRVQRKAIPLILEGKDVLVNAVTGSGKTASYLLPVLEKHVRRVKLGLSQKAESRVLIMQPTRELAAQCCSMLDELKKFVPHMTYSCVFGGSSLLKQEKELKENPDIIVATPGRLIDLLLNSKNIYLNTIDTLILDEADKLMEMGFEQLCTEVLKHINS